MNKFDEYNEKLEKSPLYLFNKDYGDDIRQVIRFSLERGIVLHQIGVMGLRKNKGTLYNFPDKFLGINISPTHANQACGEE